MVMSITHLDETQMTPLDCCGYESAVLSQSSAPTCYTACMLGICGFQLLYCGCLLPSSRKEYFTGKNYEL